MVQNPLKFCGGKIRIDQQPCAVSEHVGMTRIPQLLAKVSGAAVLPDDRIVDRLACLAVPDDGGLALVCDPDRYHVSDVDVSAFNHLATCASGSAP